MRPDIFLATIGRGSNGSNALEVTEDRAAVTAESQDNIINRVNNISQYGPSWHYVPGIGVAGTAYAEVPGSALGDLAFSRASSKTRTNSAGVVETIGSNVPPHDYRNADGTLSTFPRLNLEPQRTNSIRNSSMVGAVAGSPGTLPTNYTASLAGLTQTIVGTGTENGLQYIDYRLSGTATGNAELRLEGNTIAASTGQAWTMSTYFKAISGAPNSTRLVIIERTAIGTYIVDGSTGALAVDSTLKRFTFTRTLSGGVTVALVQPVIFFFMTAGQSYDFTIRIAAPQMELGAYASTWVPTTTAAVTRLADAFTRSNIFTNGFITAAGGTLIIELNNNISLTRSSGADIVQSLGVSNGTDAGIVIRTAGTSRAQVYKYVSGSPILMRTTDADIVKIAIKWNGTSADVFENGVKVVSASSFTTTNMEFLRGSAVDFPKNISAMYIARTPLSDAQCIQMTTL